MDSKEVKGLARDLIDPLKGSPLLLVILLMFAVLVGYSFWQMDQNADAVQSYVLKQQTEQWDLISRLVDELDKCEEVIRGKN